MLQLKNEEIIFFVRIYELCSTCLGDKFCGNQGAEVSMTGRRAEPIGRHPGKGRIEVAQQVGAFLDHAELPAPTART